MPKVVGKRIYNSIFDPFREQIEEMIDDGFSVKQIWNTLPEGYSYESLYGYIRVNKIREKGITRHVDAKHQCDTCEYCKHFVNGKGRANKQEDRICTKSWRVITVHVRHCPRWCELEAVVKK